jgi:hypothetical protein
MTEMELDSIYGELCRALTQVGEASASLFLARFALLAIGEIGDAGRARALLTNALTNFPTSLSADVNHSEYVA